MHRRELMIGGGAVLAARWAPARAAASAPDPAPFDAQSVRNLARALAAQPFKRPDATLPNTLKNIDYQDYRAIRFDPGHALWRDLGLGFTVEFFHRGFLFKDKVEIFQVADGQASPIRYSPDLFTFGKTAPPPASADLGFAGFRIHAPINRSDYYDASCQADGSSAAR